MLRKISTVVMEYHSQAQCKVSNAQSSICTCGQAKVHWTGDLVGFISFWDMPVKSKVLSPSAEIMPRLFAFQSVTLWAMLLIISMFMKNCNYCS
jgi:hypothetical protein